MNLFPTTPARILIVEDDTAAARLLEAQLRDVGHQVIGVTDNGETALRLAETGQPDLVIMDIVLRGGLDGIETAALLAQRQDIPVLYLTAYSDEELYARARATSPLAYLHKPYDERELKRGIELALDRHALLSRLKESEAHLAEAQAVANLGSWYWDLAQDRVELSAELLRLLGLTPGGFEPRFATFLEMAHVDDRPRMLAAVEAHLSGDDPGDIDIRVSADGVERVLRLRGRMRRNADGRAEALLGTARDITEKWQLKKVAESHRMHLEQAVATRTAELSAANARLTDEIERRRQVEEMLLQNEERYRNLVENLPEPLLVMQDEQIVFANQALARLLGLPTASAALGMATSALVHADSLAACVACKQASLAGQPPSAPTPLKVLHADGSVVEVEVVTFPLDYEGSPAVLAVLRDLSARRAMELVTERFRAALDSSADAFFLIDPQAMHFIDVNASACASLGYSREQLLQLGPHDIKPHFNKTMLRQRIADVQAGKPGAETLVTRHQHKDGSTFPVEIRLRPFASGGQPLLVAVARDISERIRVEADLRETEARFRQLAESIDEAFWIRDLHADRFLYANPAYERLYGKNVESLYRHPRSFLGCVHPDDQARIAAAYDNQRAGSTDLDVEYRVVVAGQVRWLWVRTFPILDADGKVYRSVGIAQDVTARRYSEEQYRTLLQASMDGFWLTDAHGRILSCNDAACRLTGYLRDELLTLSVNDLEVLESRSQTLKHIQRISERGFDRFETRHRCKGGHIIDVDISVYFQAGPDGGNYFAFIRDISARKQAETELKLLTNRLALAARAANVGIWDWDILNDELVWDDAMYRLYGITRDEFGGAFAVWVAGLHPDDRDQTVAASRMALSGEKEFDIEFRIVWPDRSIRYLKGNAVVLRDESGKPLRMIGTNWDITESKRAETALRMERDNNQRYLDTVQTLMVAVDNQGRITMLNRKACEVLGYREDELLGRNWLETCLPQPIHNVIVPVMEQILTGNLQPVEYFENPVLCRDGSQRLIAWRNASLTDAQGNIAGILGSGEDITERKRSEQALIESEERYRAVVEDQTELIARLRADGCLIFVSDSYCRFFGKTRQALLGTTWHPIVEPEDQPMIEAKLSLLAPPNPVVVIENRVHSGGGELRWMQFVNRAFFDSDGQVIEIQAVGRDITDRKQAELALSQSEALSRSILRAAPVGIGMLVNRVFQQVNQAMTQMTGYAREELIGQTARKLYPTQADFDYVGTEKYRQIHERGIGTVETRWLRKDGKIIDVLLSSSPVVPGDLDQGVTFTAQDITVSKQDEQERVAHEAAQRAALVREVHHRIKNNLQGVIGLLRQHVADYPATQAALEAAIAQVNTIAVVYGLQGRMPQSEMRLRELLHEVAAAAASLALLPQLPRLEDTLDGDVWLDNNASVSIALILNELIHNAIKHSQTVDGSGVVIGLSGDSQRATLHISNPGGPLPTGFDLTSGKGCGTGLDLIRTLLPRRAAKLKIVEGAGFIETELVLDPPLITEPVLPAYAMERTA